MPERYLFRQARGRMDISFRLGTNSCPVEGNEEWCFQDTSTRKLPT